MEMLLLFLQTAAASSAPVPAEPATPPHVRKMTVLSSPYPKAALDAGQQGKVSYVVTIDAKGHPTDCHITGSSGYAVLDAETCKLASHGFVYEPAHDAEGHPVSGELASARTWNLPR